MEVASRRGEDGGESVREEEDKEDKEVSYVPR